MQDVNRHRIEQLNQGRCHDPFALLGQHHADKGITVTALLPSAELVELDTIGQMQRLPETSVFTINLTTAQASKLPRHHRINWTEAGQSESYSVVSPYSFEPFIPDDDLYLFAEGKHLHIYRHLGAHACTKDAISGVQFALWAPGVKRVSVIGDFNAWNGLRHPMRSRGVSGVWEIFIPGLQASDLYKFEILNQHNQILVKTDPYAQQMTLRPDTASRVCPGNDYDWQDAAWLERRKNWNWQHSPMNAYELHLGSWRRTADGQFLNYRETADQLVPYVNEMGFTHIELLPIMEHPLDESWGYQVSGYFAPTARYGEPSDLRYLIDLCHGHGIGVILDWVPGHFPKDDFALARFTGDTLYEHSDPRRGEHPDWGTLIFDYGRNEVRNFLLSNVIYWLEEFHLDGFRVDAVASMLYLDYSRKANEWLPNQFGGRENLEAIHFLREMNSVVHDRFPGCLTIAEESTAWPMVSRPVSMGGLGFSMKWNMGWMNDSLSYMQNDPVHRAYHHNKLTFSQLYAYSENFVLPLSHDEVVHMKHSLLDKMPGDHWQKFANLRLLYAWQITHPGKKLLFMGAEFAQWQEWDESRSLDWHLLEHDNHRGIKTLIKDLNHLYRDETALHAHDFVQDGFEWLDCDNDKHSVLLFIRRSQDESLLCLFNFTPVTRNHYRIGLPEAGHYQEIFNSDSHFYAGSNCGNTNISCENTSYMGHPQSAVISLPPLAMLILKKMN